MIILASCETSPLGRSQLHLLNDAQVEAAGSAAFAKLKEQTPQSHDASVMRYVQCTADAISREIRHPRGTGAWEVVVFDKDEANAFALPGRKIGVYKGILKYAVNPDQLSAVIAHEVAHVLANHFNERLSTTQAAQSGLQVIQVLTGTGGSGQSQLLAALGLGAQVGLLMPFERAQETEADLLGLDLMARAGFDPRESVRLWTNMAKAPGSRAPQFLSTHPSPATRMRDLNGRMPSALQLYEEARAAGRRPNCQTGG